MVGRRLKDYTIEWQGVIVKASSKENAEKQAKQIIENREVELDFVEETDWETLEEKQQKRTDKED